MKKTRFTAALLSAAMMCSTAAALPASAVSTISDFSPSAYAGFTELDRELGMIDGSDVYDFIAMRYLKVDENKSVTEVELSEYPDNIVFSLTAISTVPVSCREARLTVLSMQMQAMFW